MFSIVFLNSCPTNCGTGMRASVHAKLPHVGAHPDFKKWCAKLRLQVGHDSTVGALTLCYAGTPCACPPIFNLTKLLTDYSHVVSTANTPSLPAGFMTSATRNVSASRK